MKEPLEDNWFEEIYRRPESQIPWNIGRPFSALVKWVEVQNPPRGPAIVIGCGLGYDAIFLASAGFQVTGMDISPTAIERARSKARAAGVNPELRVADIFDLPADLAGSYRYAIEIATFQAVPKERRKDFAAGLASLLVDGGMALMLCLNNLFGEKDSVPYTISAETIRDSFPPYFDIMEIRPTFMYDHRIEDGYFVTMRKRAAVLQGSVQQPPSTTGN